MRLVPNNEIKTRRIEEIRPTMFSYFMTTFCGWTTKMWNALCDATI